MFDSWLRGDELSVIAERAQKMIEPLEDPLELKEEAKKRSGTGCSALLDE